VALKVRDSDWLFTDADLSLDIANLAFIVGDQYFTDSAGSMKMFGRIKGDGVTRTITTFDTVYQPTLVYDNVEEFNASGTFILPAGVTEVLALVVGGGAGGGGAGTNDNSTANQDTGGAGGLSFGTYAIAGNTAVTVGNGGSGSDTLGGSSGGTSSFGTLSGPGGSSVVSGTGAGGNGSGGNIITGGSVSENWINEWDPLAEGIYFNDGGLFEDLLDNTYTVNTDGGTAANAWTSAQSVRPGCGGRGETSSVGNNASGGWEGTVIIWWASP